MLEVCLCR